MNTIIFLLLYEIFDIKDEKTSVRIYGYGSNYLYIVADPFKTKMSIGALLLA